MPRAQNPHTGQAAAIAQNETTKLAPPPRKTKADGKRGVEGRKHPADKGIRALPDTGSAARAALVDENKPLTEQQLIFVRAWASGESVKTASARAGYNDAASFAYRMTKMPNVLKVYRAEKVKYEAAGDMSRKRVMDGLIEAVEMAKLMAEPATMVSGWREIGRMCGYYEPVKHTLDINVKGDVTVRQLNAMTDADLLKVIKGNAAPLQLLDRVDDDDAEV